MIGYTTRRDTILAECDRVGDSCADYSRKHRRRGVNVQVVTDPDGRLLWLSPVLPGRAHDLTVARTYRIIRICERQGVPILADLAYQGGGPWLTMGIKRRPLQELIDRRIMILPDPEPLVGRPTPRADTPRARHRP